MKYILRYHMSRPLDLAELRSAFPAHVARWGQYRDKGVLLAIGPMERPEDGALSVFTNREDAEAFAINDPFVTTGLVARWEITGWQEALMDPSGSGNGSA